ncbi:hypothetical protein [Streptomyces sp. NPDC047108]|uniref:hypothetical protein n=1 Tax=Streptomyces sp. NPDC047108 TaxID=3155025 RepID=UPI0033DAF209
MVLYLLIGAGAGAAAWCAALLVRRRRRPTDHLEGLLVERAAAERTRLMRETCGTGAPEPLG